MIAGIAQKRSQIAGLISSDLRSKRELKKRTTAADLLKAKMNIGGMRDVAELRREGAMDREKVGQTGATYRKNITIAADKFIQGMRGKQALGVQALRNVGTARIQDIRGEQAEDLLGQQADVAKWAAEEEDFRAQAQARTALATIPVMDTGDFAYDLNDPKKKKEENKYLTMPGQ